MNFIAILMQLLPYLPALVRTVEAIHGGAPGQGAQKLETAISLIQHVAPAITQAITADPANKGKVEGLIGGVVAGINAAKTWKAPDNSSPFPQ